VKFSPFFINHNVFFNSNSPKDFEELYSGINTNSGNGLIAESLAKILGVSTYPGGIQNLFTCSSEDIEPELVNLNFSHAFLILEDHIGEQWNSLPWARMQALLERINLPLIVFSLGCCGVGKTAETISAEISPEARSFFSFLCSKSLAIGVRGALTAEVLTLLGGRNHDVVGCPTYFSSGRDRVVDTPRISLDSKVVGTGLFTSNVINDVHYVLQSEKALLRALLDIKTFEQADADSFMAVPWPGYSEKILHALDQDRVRFFTGPHLWQEYFDDRVALTIGTRVHGSIVSLNKGRPAIVTAGDVRAQEMCALFQIPHFPGEYLANASLEELSEKANPDDLNAAYPELYDNFRNWLINSCGLTLPDTPLKSLDWDFYNAEVFPGPIAAERVRGAIAVSQGKQLVAALQRAEASEAKFSAELERLAVQYEAHCEKMGRLEAAQKVMALKEAALSGTLSDAQAHCAIVEHSLREMESELAALYKSKSWRLTRPLRHIAQLIRKG
jgi:hypothetical protein